LYLKNRLIIENDVILHIYFVN
ncbi:hypothetical protein EHRUM3_04050, partial [Ehrlichia ruminantium]